MPAGACGLAITIRDLFCSPIVSDETSLLQPTFDVSPSSGLLLARNGQGSGPFHDDVRVAVAMGSASDWDTMRAAVEILQRFDITFDVRVVSAHRMPEAMFAFADEATRAASTGKLGAIIAGAGGAAHLPGMLAAKTPVPVLGVPVPSRHLNGMDSLYSIVQMPRGIPVATFAIGTAGAANAALFAVAMLAVGDPLLTANLAAWRAEQTTEAATAQLGG